MARNSEQDSWKARVEASTANVDQVIRDSETAVLATGDCVNRIVRCAREHMAESGLIIRQLAQSTEVSAAVDAQTRAMGDFVEALSERLHQQHSAALRASEHSASIQLAGGKISKIAASSRMLNLNARIEAARLGSAGKPFAIIAEQMGELSRDVAATNAIVTKLAEALASVMPKIAEGTTGLCALTEEFSDTFAARSEAVRQGEERLQTGVHKVLKESEQRSEQILSISQEALSHLQYQDPCAQKLLALRKSLGQMADRIDQVLLGTHVSMTTPPPASVMQEESSMSEGELLMF